MNGFNNRIVVADRRQRSSSQDSIDQSIWVVMSDHVIHVMSCAKSNWSSMIINQSLNQSISSTKKPGYTQ